MAEDAAPHPAAPDPVVPALTRESTGQSVSGRTPSNANGNANGNASVNFQLSSGRRQSSSARINEILEVRFLSLMFGWWLHLCLSCAKIKRVCLKTLNTSSIHTRVNTRA